MTEIPPSFTYEKYESYLEGLIQKGTLVSYDDHSAETPHYVLKFRRAILSQLLKRNRLEKLLKMQERVGENYTTLDESGSLKIFESPEQIVEYFVKFRLKYYGIRKKRMIQRLERELTVADFRKRFVEEILAGSIVINNRSKKEIESSLTQKEYKRINASYDYLLGMPIHSLTKEKALDLKNLYKIKLQELSKTKDTDPRAMYEKDLRQLLKKIN